MGNAGHSCAHRRSCLLPQRRYLYFAKAKVPSWKQVETGNNIQNLSWATTEGPFILHRPLPVVHKVCIFLTMHLSKLTLITPLPWGMMFCMHYHLMFYMHYHLFKPHDKPIRDILLLAPLCRCRNWGLEHILCSYALKKNPCLVLSSAVTIFKFLIISATNRLDRSFQLPRGTCHLTDKRGLQRGSQCEEGWERARTEASCASCCRSPISRQESLP